MLTQISAIKVLTGDLDLIQIIRRMDGVLSCGGLVETTGGTAVNHLAIIRPGCDTETVLNEICAIADAIIVRDGRSKGE
jgi:hypothetical protein